MAAQETLTGYQRAARQKWPSYTVSGDGRFAILCPEIHKVELYPLYFAAAADLRNDHANWECAERHVLVELKPAPRPKPLFIRNLPDD